METHSSDLSACSVKSALNYKSLPEKYFFWTALISHLTILTLALTIKDLEFVYEMTGLMYGGFFGLLVPGLTYILMLRKYGKPSHLQLWSTVFYQTLAWVFMALFLAAVSAFVYL